MALILDTLSGRSPLYRLERSFKDMDLELLLGVDIEPSKLNDDAVGRVLDQVWEARTDKLLTSVALKPIKMFSLDTSRVHHDTTSVTMHGDYDLYADPEHGQPFVITYGCGKDYLPDLKQLVHHSAHDKRKNYGVIEGEAPKRMAVAASMRSAIGSDLR